MSTTKSSGTGIAYMTPLPKQFRQIANKKGKAPNDLAPIVMETAGPSILDQFEEKFRLDGIAAGLDGSQEFRVFEDFLGRHVQANRICDVQCMLLWNEWVRTYRRQTPGYPKRILEKEFREIITENYDVKIAHHDIRRGAVYHGIKFIP
jgi:hypothetical protein